MIEAHIEIALLLCLQEAVISDLELFPLNILVGKRLNNSYAREIILYPGINFRNLNSVLSESFPHSSVHKVSISKHERKKDKTE